MPHLLRAALITSMLCLPNLSVAQTIFDVSGSLSQPNGTVATFSGTLTVSVENNIVMGIGSWDIQIPAIGTGSTALPALTFTPANSKFVQVALGSPDDPMGWGWAFYACGSGSSNCTFLQLGFDNGNPDFISLPLGSLPLGYFTSGGLGVNAGYGNQISSSVGSASIGLATTPEPSSLVLVGSGLAGMMGFRRKLFSRGHP